VEIVSKTEGTKEFLLSAKFNARFEVQSIDLNNLIAEEAGAVKGVC
jgi:hypothetical protein